MKIEFIPILLAAMVGTANAANKRRRVVKIYSQEEIRAERESGRNLRGGNFDPFIGIRQLEEGSMSMSLTPAELSLSMGLTPAEMSMSMGFLSPAEMSMSMGLVPAEMSMSMGLVPAEMSMSMPSSTATEVEVTDGEGESEVTDVEGESEKNSFLAWLQGLLGKN
jgi:hypothetical protein